MTFIHWIYFVSSITVDIKIQFSHSVISLFLYPRLTIIALDKPQGEIFLCKDLKNTTHYGKSSAKYAAGAILWNNLAPTIREIPSYKMFKKQLQSFYLASYPE